MAKYISDVSKKVLTPEEMFTLGKALGCIINYVYTPKGSLTNNYSIIKDPEAIGIVEQMIFSRMGLKPSIIK